MTISFGCLSGSVVVLNCCVRFGCVYVCVCACFVMCGCSDNCVGILVVGELVFYLCVLVFIVF